MNVYTTEKEVTYRANLTGRQQTKNVTTPKLLLEECLRHGQSNACNRLTDLYQQFSTNTDGSARIEIRVPMSQATNALTSLPEDVLRQSLIAIPREEFW